MNITSVPIREFLPHEPPMVLLDRIVSYEEPKLVTEITIRPGIPFYDENGVPGWIGLEYMAQSVAAYAGVQAHLREAPPSIGFLLGTRAYKCAVTQFPLGVKLKILVESLFVDSGLASFSCCIEIESPIAFATINVYQPDNDSLEDFWAGEISR